MLFNLLASTALRRTAPKWWKSRFTITDMFATTTPAITKYWTYQRASEWINAPLHLTTFLFPGQTFLQQYETHYVLQMVTSRCISRTTQSNQWTKNRPNIYIYGSVSFRRWPVSVAASPVEYLTASKNGKSPAFMSAVASAASQW